MTGSVARASSKLTPFKRQPALDEMLAAIQRADVQARLLLHDIESSDVKQLMLRRLRDEGADMDRVHFLPAQPHHRLLADAVKAQLCMMYLSHPAVQAHIGAFKTCAHPNDPLNLPVREGVLSGDTHNGLAPEAT